MSEELPKEDRSLMSFFNAFHAIGNINNLRPHDNLGAAIETIVEEALMRLQVMKPRNCDVGTPEEHSIRFFEFCASNASGKGINQSCKPTCPCIDCFDICQCLCRWAQMPYTEGSAK